MAFDPQTGQFDFADWDIKQTVRDLRAYIPRDNLLDQAEQLVPYECDGLSAYRKVPKMVVLPETVEQCQQVLRYCRQKAPCSAWP